MAQADDALRAERALALSEATQTIQRFFTCSAEGVNSNGDPVRDAHAAACMREEVAPDVVVVFNNVPLDGADAVVGTFTAQGPAAVQFDNTILEVHSIVDRGFRPRTEAQAGRIELRLTVVIPFTNTITTPVIPLAPGNYIVHASEEFVLEEAVPGKWLIRRVEVTLLSNIPIPANSFPTPFPVIPGVDAGTAEGSQQ